MVPHRHIGTSRPGLGIDDSRSRGGMTPGATMNRPQEIGGMTNRVELAIAERFPFAGGHEFGAPGPYERLIGRAHFAVDPHSPAQQGITDLDKAPTDADGLVRFAGD